MKPNLTTEFAGLKFKNPVTVASGTFGSKDEYVQYLDYSKLGAIVTKTVTLIPRKGNKMPRIYETPSGMLNAIGLQNKGIDDFIQNKIPYFRKIKTHLIVNIAGESIEDFVSLAKKLDREKGVSALELNISCPNVKKGLEFCMVPLLAAEVVQHVRLGRAGGVRDVAHAGAGEAMGGELCQRGCLERGAGRDPVDACHVAP